MILSEYALENHPSVFYVPNFVTGQEEEYILRKINGAPKPKWKTLSNRRLQVWGGDVSANRLIPQRLPPFLNSFPDIIGRLRETGAFISSKHGEPNHVIVNEYLPGQGIMPHEDGSSYHPVVATISLRSHTVFNYYRYQPQNDVLDVSFNSDTLEDRKRSSSTQRGRPVDPQPVLSILLEPRSLVITTGSFYTEHLHGIEAVSEDVLRPADATEGLDHDVAGVLVANRRQLHDAKTKDVAMNGGILQRETRVSLTCRDVERVMGFQG
ncbi:hypothetical protein BD410DRAFT_812647 [Rickenella mellea]|uniref:Fe2OG dioxygenase domain-containing protein n=1 Tax=Rickenella mellea TaxID=50990 RepID=A0A4Y7QJ21_9AGAM|nr:hypothetical protein BD410DRAFT_812647 [Rickenella mellea]